MERFHGHKIAGAHHDKKTGKITISLSKEVETDVNDLRVQWRIVQERKTAVLEEEKELLEIAEKLGISLQ